MNMNHELFMKLRNLPGDPLGMALYAATASVVKRSTNNPCLRGPVGSHRTASRLRAEAFEAAKEAIRADDFAALSKLVSNPKQANWHAEKQAWSLLDEAVKNQSVPMVNWLLDKGANPNTLFLEDRPFAAHKRPRPGMYFSPLATAIDMRYLDIALLLLDRGAKLSLPTVWLEEDDNVSCRELAEDRGMWPSITAFFSKREAEAVREQIGMATGQPSVTQSQIRL